MAVSSLPVLPRAFYEHDTIAVARALLGQVIVHAPPGGGQPVRAGRIVETEAYLARYRGQPDRAAHAWRGITPRTRVLFGPGGHAYVYLIYGMHECLNLVAEAEGTPGCVLIRALEPVAGVEAMFAARPAARRLEELCSGPGKLTAALGITREAHYGADVTRGPLTVRQGPAPRRIAVGGRIGIRHGADWPLRFWLPGHGCVNRAS